MNVNLQHSSDVVIQSNIHLSYFIQLRLRALLKELGGPGTQLFWSLVHWPHLFLPYTATITHKSLFDCTDTWILKQTFQDWKHGRCSGARTKQRYDAVFDTLTSAICLRVESGVLGFCPSVPLYTEISSGPFTTVMFATAALSPRNKRCIMTSVITNTAIFPGIEPWGSDYKHRDQGLVMHRDHVEQLQKYEFHF